LEPLFQQTWKAFLRVMELVLELVDGKLTYTEFQKRLRERLDELGREICQSVSKLPTNGCARSERNAKVG